MEHCERLDKRGGRAHLTGGGVTLGAHLGDRGAQKVQGPTAQDILEGSLQASPWDVLSYSALHLLSATITKMCP